MLDLFAGLGGWSAPFRERGHDVVTVDIDPRFETTLVADVFDLPDDLDGERFDIVCASPPCEKFSVMTMGRYWLPGRRPRGEEAELAIELVRKTVRIIEATAPAFWLIENPTAMLRKLHLIPYELRAVTFCRYGTPYRKPTDLWGGFPPSLELRPRWSAPRGSRTGVQGDLAAFHSGSRERADLAALRAVIPYELALDVCIAAERDLAAGRRPGDYTGHLFVGGGAES
jgi:hypothetical protein